MIPNSLFLRPASNPVGRSSGFEDRASRREHRRPMGLTSDAKWHCPWIQGQCHQCFRGSDREVSTAPWNPGQSRNNRGVRYGRRGGPIGACLLASWITAMAPRSAGYRGSAGRSLFGEGPLPRDSPTTSLPRRPGYSGPELVGGTVPHQPIGSMGAG